MGYLHKKLLYFTVSLAALLCNPSHAENLFVKFKDGTDVTLSNWEIADNAVAIGLWQRGQSSYTLNQWEINDSSAPTPSLGVSSGILEFGNGSDTKSINVSSNVNWSVSDNRSWISVSPTSGLNNGAVNVTVEANGTTSSRSGTVTVSGGGLSQSINISQDPDIIQSGLWRNAEQYANGWSSTPWFGFFMQLGQDWIYHLEHGFQYCLGEETSSYFSYDLNMQSWFWSSAQLYPYMYKFGANSGWYWYYEGAEIAQRWFNRLANGEDLLEAQMNESGEQPVPEGMVLVEGGTLAMSMGTVSVDTFYIGHTEVTWGEWQAVRDFAASNGYDIGSRGVGCADDHPVRAVAWYDVVKWCNAKSEMEGLTPVYSYIGSTYKSGEPSHTSIFQDSSASGYRLPLEAEWEFAARGGNQTNGYRYAGSNDLDAVGWYRDNSSGAACGGTWPVGQKAANELGLYDMSGNVFECCWDQYNSYQRIFRGGGWFNYAVGCTVSYRFYNRPDARNDYYGFRLARSLGN